MHTCVDAHSIKTKIESRTAHAYHSGSTTTSHPTTQWCLGVPTDFPTPAISYVLSRTTCYCFSSLSMKETSYMLVQTYSTQIAPLSPSLGQPAHRTGEATWWRSPHRHRGGVPESCQHMRTVNCADRRRSAGPSSGGVGIPGGAEIPGHALRPDFLNPDVVTVQVDRQNTFNLCDRSAMHGCVI